MKKYISIFLVAILGLFTFASCDPETDEKAGGTNVEKMAGQWVVTVDAIGEDGSVIIPDPYGIGEFELNTYNTAANDADKMWLNESNFWGIKMKVNITDYKNGKFAATPNTSYNISDDEAGNVEILEGEVLYNAGKNIHGMPVDSICFKVKFDDDDNGLTYQIAGVRYQGFKE